MIELKIKINEGKTKNFRTIKKTDIVVDIEVDKEKGSFHEHQALESILEQLQVNKKHQIIDKTKDQKAKNLQEAIDEFCEFLEDHTYNDIIRK